MGGAGVRAISITSLPQFQVGHREDLRAKTWCQVFKSRHVLVHDLLGTQPPLIHSVLEGPHKLFKHPPNPYFGEDFVFRNVFGERLRDAGFKAAKKKDTIIITWIQ